MDDTKEEARLYVQCSKKHVKTVKTWLEEQRALDKHEKIKPVPKDEDAASETNNEGSMLIPTIGLTIHAFVLRFGYSTSFPEAERILNLSFNTNGLPDHIKESLTARFYKNTMTNKDGINNDDGLNELQKMFRDFLHYPSTFRMMQDINAGLDEQSRLTFKKLFDAIPKRWALYPPMIMLPPDTFNSDWNKLLSESFLGDTNFLWQNILEAFSKGRVKFTHIALNKGIPLANDDEADNTIRAPSSKMKRLYGDFGPTIPARRFYLPPDADDLIGKEDFDDAFWVCTKQNGLYQVWAPRWTMFSRGNIKEKARVLTFSDAFSYTKEGKKKQRVVTAAEDKAVSRLRGDQVSSSSDKEVIVIDSSSDGQLSPEKAKTTMQLKDDLHGPSIPVAAAKATSKVGAVDKTDVSTSPADTPEQEPEPCSNTKYIAPDDVGLHLDGDTPNDGQLPGAPKNNKRKLVTFQSPKPDKIAKPKLQEVQLALDLYAGIGYFTMSYLKLGYDVIAYELNPFSVEGLRRGVKANNFGCTVIRGKQLIELTEEEKKKRLVQDVSWSVGGEDKNHPIVLDEDAKKTGDDEGYASQTIDNGIVYVGDADAEGSDEDVVIVKGSSNERTAAANTGGKDKETIVIDDDADVDATPSRVEESLFVDQDTPLTASTTNTQNAASKGKVKAKRGSSIPPPPKPETPITLQSLEAQLQGQFTRPPRVIVYEQSNTAAYINFLDLSTRQAQRGGNPYCIRHINLGFLPSSSDSWDTAAQLIATNIDGGFIHVHENVDVHKIKAKQNEIYETFDELINPYTFGHQNQRFEQERKRGVRIVHVEMVKSYAPGVWHVVFDVKVGKKNAVSREEKRDRANDAGYFDGADGVAFSADEEWEVVETTPLPKGRRPSAEDNFGSNEEEFGEK